MRKVSFWGIAVAVFAIAASNVQAATPGRERGATSQVRIEGFRPLDPDPAQMVCTPRPLLHL